MPATLTNTGVSWPNRTASGQGSGEATPSVDQQHGHRLRRRWPPSRWSEDNPDGDIVDHSAAGHRRRAHGDCEPRDPAHPLDGRLGARDGWPDPRDPALPRLGQAHDRRPAAALETRTEGTPLSPAGGSLTGCPEPLPVACWRRSRGVSGHPARLGRRALRRRPRPVATEAAALEDDLSPVVVDSQPPPAPRSASRSSTTAAPPAARADAPRGAALESAPGRALAARRFRRREGGARRGRRWKSPGPKVDGTPVIRPTVTARRRLDSASSSSPSARAAAGEMR